MATSRDGHSGPTGSLARLWLMSNHENQPETPDRPETPETPETSDTVEHASSEAAAPAPPHPEARKPESRWRERTFGFRSAVALGLGGLILGGVAGTTVGFLVDGGRDGGPGHHGRPFDHEGRPPVDRDRGLPPGLPPSTAPDTETDPSTAPSASPSDSASTS